jgi:hypothetical protein
VLKKIKVEEAIGTQLAHDITEIRPGEFKGPAFRKGHTVCNDDICHLQKLGKNHLYLLDLEEDEVHENQAASILAEASRARASQWENNPREGKIGLHAAVDGLLTIDTAALAAFNMVDEVMCATLHSHTLVKKGELVAATRAIPLVMKRAPLERAAAIAAPKRRCGRGQTPAAGPGGPGDHRQRGLPRPDRGQVRPDSKRQDHRPGVRGGGNNLCAGRRRPDRGAIRRHLDNGCDLLLLSGGMSVDPDDVTRKAIRLAGAGEVHYGAAALPGAMFLTAAIGEVPLLGVPACGLHHRVTVLDLVLPRILAGERIGRKELAFLGPRRPVPGLPRVRYPHCPFGKSTSTPACIADPVPGGVRLRRPWITCPTKSFACCNSE